VVGRAIVLFRFGAIEQQLST